MRELLQVASKERIAPAYVSRLLAAFPTRESAPVPAAAVGLERDLVEALNDRELQILRLLAARLSYREIAEELYLSLNTIKWYARNIYSKLGVNNRTQAVLAAERLSVGNSNSMPLP